MLIWDKHEVGGLVWGGLFEDGGLEVIIMVKGRRFKGEEKRVYIWYKIIGFFGVVAWLRGCISALGRWCSVGMGESRRGWVVRLVVLRDGCRSEWSRIWENGLDFGVVQGRCFRSNWGRWAYDTLYSLVWGSG
jgi:hypothetical protein